MTTTKWTCSVDSNGTANLYCELTEDGQQPTTEKVKLKGVCYSPAPINGSNSYAPALGDWYWDDFEAGSTFISSWSPLLSRDFPNFRNLHNNSLRVYCMLSRQLEGNGTFPSPWNNGHYFTHKNFLDLAWDKSAPPEAKMRRSVLVGIPLPATMFWKTQYDQASKTEIDYWTNVLRETVRSVADHPAVMGFTIQNEQDGADVCYNNPDWAAFWWGQVEKMAAIVKEEAPGKLAGMATHDDPNIPLKASSYMENCPSIDFWGVNTYQTETFESIFKDYGSLPPKALKPVLFTEWGMPATSHRDPNNPGTIYADDQTCSKAAQVAQKMLPQAFAHPLCIGLYYFEYCDELWNQPEAPNIYTWWGGPPAPGFPNGYWDNDGFGLVSVQRGPGLPNDAPIWANTGPSFPIDVHTNRNNLFSTVANVFKTTT